MIPLLVAAVLGLASCATTGSSMRARRPAEGGRPNIVFVLTDDLSANLVDYMPHVKQMQRQGLNFSNYFVTDSLCCPSRTSILTGKYPHNSGVFTNLGSDGGYATFNAHGNENSTFATALKKVGYRTAMMGKYLNGYQPADGVQPGWDEWDVAGDAYAEFGYDLNENGRIKHYGSAPSDYLTDVMAGKGAEFIEQSAKADQPFVLELATFAPHAPFIPAPRDADGFPGLTAPRTPAFNEADMSDKPSWLRTHRELGPAQMRGIDTAFRMRAQAVQAVDDMVGRLQAALKATGTDRDTYVVFTSDNGFHLGDHRLPKGKQTAFETDIHVPMVVTGPGIKAGTTTGALTQNTDLCPTFENLAGVTVPGTVDGRSLIPLLGDAAQRWSRDAVLIEHHHTDKTTAGPDYQNARDGNPPGYEAIRTASEMYVEYADGEREYYDLRSDPYELDNSVNRLSNARRKWLTTKLHELQKCHGSDCHT